MSSRAYLTWPLTSAEKCSSVVQQSGYRSCKNCHITMLLVVAKDYFWQHSKLFWQHININNNTDGYKVFLIHLVCLLPWPQHSVQLPYLATRCVGMLLALVLENWQSTFCHRIAILKVEYPGCSIVVSERTALINDIMEMLERTNRCHLSPNLLILFSNKLILLCATGWCWTCCGLFPYCHICNSIKEHHDIVDDIWWRIKSMLLNCSCYLLSIGSLNLYIVVNTL